MNLWSHGAAIVLLLVLLQGRDDPPPTSPDTLVLRDCSHCHEAANPATGAAALKSCSRHQFAEPLEPSVSEAPEVFLLDQLSEIYVPVVFPHKLHAAMSKMGRGCETCHHRHEKDRIPPCRECHGGPSNPVNLRQPALKGAYHRLCLGCHREWTHATDCVVCHAKREPGVEVKLPTDPDDIMGQLHPNVEVPDVKVYRVDSLEEAPYVTFYHKEHIELFGLQCVDCHEKENCTRCHEVGPHPAHVRKEPHEDCDRCHLQKPTHTDCARCHAETQRPGFNHLRRTGFDPRIYHGDPECRLCHGTDKGFSGLDAMCGSCHAPDWQPSGAFDHSLTGVTLDEAHGGLDCQDCHIKGVGRPASCDACHDDQRRRFHTKTGLLLDETHVELHCQECHPKGLGTSPVCSNCHDDARTTFPIPAHGDGSADNTNRPAGFTERSPDM